MSTGTKQNYGREVDSGSWQDDYSVAKAAAEKLDIVTSKVTRKPDSTPYFTVDAKYSGSAALTLSDYNGFPAGSTILCYGLTTKTLFLKVDATTWVKNEFAAII